MTCTIANCPEKAALTIVSAESHGWSKEEHFCEKHGKEFMARYHAEAYPMVANRSCMPEFLPFEIELILINSPDISDEHCVYLRQIGGNVRFFLTIGWVEAWSLVHSLKHQTTNRPLTHMAFANTIKCLGCRLQNVVLDRIDQSSHSYGAALRICQGDQVVNVDVRPTDAFNLAVVSAVPILIARRLLAEQTRVEG